MHVLTLNITLSNK